MAHDRRFQEEDTQQRGRKSRRDRNSGRHDCCSRAAYAGRHRAEHAALHSFSCFAFEGPGASLFLKGAGLIISHEGSEKFGDIYRVVAAENRELEGVFVKVSELQSYAEQGWEAYLPRAETKLPEHLENRRAVLLTALLQAIKADGGHQGVMSIIQSLSAAARLRETMASGSQDLLTMFDKTQIKKFVVEVAGKVMVLRSGSFDTPSWTLTGQGRVRTMRQVFGVKLLEAPAGAPDNAYKVGTYVVLEHLFSDKPPSSEVGALMRDLRSLFEVAGLTDKVKAKVIELGGTIPGAEPQGEAVVDDDGMVPAAAERANAHAMMVAVHDPSPVAKTAPADLVAHAAMVEAEGQLAVHH